MGKIRPETATDHQEGCLAAGAVEPEDLRLDLKAKVEQEQRAKLS
jgi:hypothetical protein